MHSSKIRPALPPLLTPLLVVMVTASASAEDQRKNVLFVISDDLNNFIGAYGDPRARTPNIDRLAQRGVLFERAYCQFPLCGPSRNSMLTGLYPNSTGILRNAQIFRQTIPSHISLPQAFRREGYFAARIGKLYHYNVPRSVGTSGHDDPGSWELELNPAGVDRMEEEDEIYSLVPGSFGGMLSWYASPRPDEEHTDGLIATEAEWMLERFARRPERPFFLAVGFFRPHTPYVSPSPYFDFYPREKMPLGEPFDPHPPGVPPAALMSHKAGHDRLNDELRRQCIQAYYAAITFMDAQLGRVLDALDRLGLAENTVIVFTSDHGYHMGEHGLWQKMSLFEESARVPLIIAAPGVGRRGEVASAPVGLIDLYPTLAELCSVTAPENLQGESLVPILQDPGHPGRGWTLSQVGRGRRRAGDDRSLDVGSSRWGYFGYSLRTPRWRYTEWDSGEEGVELYDHENDPREKTNLADRPEHHEMVARLSRQLREAVQSTHPADGEIPRLRDGLWAPNLTDP